METKEITTDLRTDFERRRDENRQAVVETFRALSREHPDAAPSRIFTAIARDRGMTEPGVRKICIRSGAYTPKKRAAAGEARS